MNSAIVSRSAAVALLWVASFARSAGGQARDGCEHVTSLTSLAPLSGSRIRSIAVVTLPPPALPGPAAMMDWVHVQTRGGTVRRQLLFTAGDTLDTLRVAETLRRLRRQRYLGAAVVDGVRCDGQSDVELTVTTRDEWSTKASLQVRSGARSVLGIAERNLFGTGREASLEVRSAAGRVGVGGTLRDPWFLGSPLSASLGASTYRDGHEWGATLATRPRSLLDPWRAELSVADLTRRAAPTTDGAGDAFRRTTGQAIGARRALVSEGSVTSLLAGVEFDRTAMRAAAGAIILGPARVQRDFRGVSAGASHVSIAFDTLTWLLPGNAVVDVPLSTEAEVVVGAGRDVAADRPALHVDAWGGRMWLPSRRSLIVADVWSSGYLGGGSVEAATARVSVLGLRGARRGSWSVRLSGERLLAPDPDVRAFSSFDPTLPALPERARLADASGAVQVERAVHVRRLSRSWSVEAAALAAGSVRWAPVLPDAEQVSVGVVGFGLRLSPNKPGRGSARLDVGLPVVGAGAVVRRPYVALSVLPWFEQDRQRDGRHDR